MRRQKFNVYRNGFIHVCERMCKSCIYRPDSPLADIVIKKQAVDTDTGAVCHSTIGTKENAVCRGFYEATPTSPLLMARHMGLIKFQEIANTRGASAPLK